MLYIQPSYIYGPTRSDIMYCCRLERPFRHASDDSHADGVPHNVLFSRSASSLSMETAVTMANTQYKHEPLIKHMDTDPDE